MAAQFLTLKLRLLANTFRRSPWQIFGIAVALLYGLGSGGFAVIALLGLRLVDVDLARSIVVVAGSVAVLGFLLVPLAFGVDDTLDPRKFGFFGLTNGRLASYLLLTAFVSVPSVGIVVVSLAQVVTWSRGALPTAAAMAGALLIATTCVLGARVTTSLAAVLLSTRRAREVSGLVALVVLVCLAPIVALLTTVDWSASGLAVLAAVADVAAWTPLGAAWAAPAEVAAGSGGEALLKLLIAAGTVAVLWVAWRALVAHMLVSPERESTARAYRGLGWFDLLPASSVGAIAARSLTYWIRDARYRSQLVIVPILPVTLVIVFLVVGVDVRTLALIPLPIMCLFLSWLVHNDVAFDSTAIWMHVSTDVSGVADRIGRVTPVLVLGVPLIAVAAPVCALVYGDPAALPILVGVSSCLLLAGLGLSSLLSAQFPYPVVHPGSSPFSQPQASGGASSFIQGVTFFATTVLTAPTLYLGAMGLLEHGRFPTLSLLAGLATGLLVLLIGIAGGARIFERRGPELLAFAIRN